MKALHTGHHYLNHHKPHNGLAHNGRGKQVTFKVDKVSKCECNYHFGIGPNLKCPIHCEDKYNQLTQKQEAGQQEPPAPKWETPDEFGLWEIFDDGSFQFLHDILFWALIPSNTKNEIHLCGVDETGLYGYDLNIEDRYDTGRSLDDVEYCMRYEQRGG